MSIINEALKKAGQPILADRPEFSRRKTRMNWGPIFIMGILLLITTPILAPMLNSPYKTGSVKEVSLGSALPGASVQMKKQFSIEEAPAPMLAGPPSTSRTGWMPNFSLSGLVYSKTDSYCLINGKVVRVGETIGDATLVEVTPSGAVLDYRGEKIVLPANAA